MNITKRTTPNKTTGRNGWKPDMIVCHITEGGYDGAVSWLCNAASKASTHYVVAKDGRVAQLVDLTDTAWGNGTNNTADDNRNNAHSTLPAVRERKVNANSYTISIEHEGRYAEAQGALPEAQLAATVTLITHIRAEVKRLFGVDIPVDRQHIVGHCEITPKTKPNCPGQKYPFDEVIRRLKGGAALPSAVAGVAATPVNTTPTLRKGDKDGTVKTLQELLNVALRGVIVPLAIDGSYGAKTDAAVREYQRRNGLAVDGIVGPKTWKVLLG